MTRHAPNIFFHSALDAKDSLGHTSIICGRSWTVQHVLQTPQRRREENRNVHTEALANPAGTTAPVIYKCRYCRGALSDCLDELLILFPDSLGVGFAVRIKAFLAALFPCRFQFGCCDVPVRSAFLGHGTQVPAKIFQCGPTEKPVTPYTPCK